MLTPTQLKLLIDYNPDTGSMQWRRRGHWVVFDGHQTERGRKMFNASFPGKPCLSTIDRDGYLCGQVFGRFYRAHRVAFAIENVRWPDETVDHKNRIRTDNRALNLRGATRFEQQQNRGIQKNNKSGTPGVHWSEAHGGWVARHTANGKRLFLGSFGSIEDAVRAKRKYV